MRIVRCMACSASPNTHLKLILDGSCCVGGLVCLVQLSNLALNFWKHIALQLLYEGLQVPPQQAFSAKRLTPPASSGFHAKQPMGASSRPRLLMLPATRITKQGPNDCSGRVQAGPRQYGNPPACQA